MSLTACIPNQAKQDFLSGIHALGDVYKMALFPAVGAAGLSGTALAIVSGVQATGAQGTVTPSGFGASSPVGVQAASNVGTATATGGASIPATASPSGVSASSGTGTPQGLGASNVLPLGVVASSAIGTATADGGGPVSATATPEGVQVTASVGQIERSTPAVRPLNITYRFEATARPDGVEASARVGVCTAAGQATPETVVLPAPKSEPAVPPVVRFAVPPAVPSIQIDPEPEPIEAPAVISSRDIAQAVGVETSATPGNVIPFGHATSEPSGVQAAAQVGMAQASGTTEPPTTEYDDSEEIALLLMMLGAA